MLVSITCRPPFYGFLLGSCGSLTDKLGVVPVAATIFFAKQDLPYAEKLDEATILATDTDDAYALGVFGDKSIFSFDPKPTDKAHVIGVFEDDSPAVVNVSLGTQGGGITYAGFHRALKVFNATSFTQLGAEASVMLHLNHPTNHPKETLSYY